jgi:DNA polymerase III sliding clamp (beta) subunit (PCNA family)
MGKVKEEPPTYGIGYDSDEIGHYSLAYGPEDDLGLLLDMNPSKSQEIRDNVSFDPEDGALILQLSRSDDIPDTILYRWNRYQHGWLKFDPDAKVRKAHDKKGNHVARINRADLLRQLETVQPGISPRGLIQQSDSFVFKDGFVYTYNDEIACQAKSPFDKAFVGAVKEKPVMAILGKLAEDEIDVEISDGELLITGKKRRAGIHMDATIELPVDKVEKPVDWKPLHEDFTDAVNIVQECASNDQSHFVITCVHLHPKYLEACDNYQLTRYKIKTGVAEPTLVKRDSLKYVTSLDMTEFSETPNWIHFRNQTGMVLSCRRYMESYPDISRILQMEEGHAATLPKGLAEAAEKAQIFSSENGENDQVFVELVPGKLRIKGQGTSGWYQEVKRLNYSGDSMSFFISPKLLIELTKRHNECTISSDRLMVNGGKFVYITVLGRDEDELTVANNAGDKSDERDPSSDS